MTAMSRSNITVTLAKEVVYSGSTKNSYNRTGSLACGGSFGFMSISGCLSKGSFWQQSGA